MFTYLGAADCVLPDGTSTPVYVNLASQQGLHDGIVGTATARDFPRSYLNEPEVTLRLPDGRARKFLVNDVLNGTRLKLVSNGEWLT